MGKGGKKGGSVQHKASFFLLLLHSTSCGVDKSSLFKWLLLQNCVKINERTFFSLKLFPGLYHKITNVKKSLLVYFLTSKNIRGIFLIIEIRVILEANKILKIEIFWGHGVLELYFKR